MLVLLLPSKSRKRKEAVLTVVVVAIVLCVCVGCGRRGEGVEEMRRSESNSFVKRNSERERARRREVERGIRVVMALMHRSY